MDADIVYVSLTAKGLRPDIMAVKRARAMESHIRQHNELIVVVMKKKNDIIRINRNSESVIKAGDGFTALDDPASLRSNEESPG